jgi:hypothetical protein
MAYCPKCGGQMEELAKNCGKCGYDFPKEGEKREGWPYSGLADVALVLGQVLAGIAALWVIVSCVRVVVQGESSVGLLVAGAIQFFLLWAAFVTFARVQRL